MSRMVKSKIKLDLVGAYLLMVDAKKKAAEPVKTTQPSTGNSGTVTVRPYTVQPYDNWTITTTPNYTYTYIGDAVIGGAGGSGGIGYMPSYTTTTLSTSISEENMQRLRAQLDSISLTAGVTIK
jgi:hypothetical protein